MLQCGAARLSLLLRAAAAAGASAAPRRAGAARLAASLAAQRARGSSARRMASPPASPASAAASAAAASHDEEDGPPLFSFAVMSDVQYADIPDGASFGGTPRFYRHSLEALRCAPARASSCVHEFARPDAVCSLRQPAPLAQRRRARAPLTPLPAHDSEAVADWRPRELACALHLGDILDGFCPKARRAAARAQTQGSQRNAGRERDCAASRARRVRHAAVPHAPLPGQPLPVQPASRHAQRAAGHPAGRWRRVIL